MYLRIHCYSSMQGGISKHSFCTNIRSYLNLVQKALGNITDWCVAMVFPWFAEFGGGRKASVEDEEKRGRPTVAVAEKKTQSRGKCALQGC